MEIDEIRAILNEARRACADVREMACGMTVEANGGARQAAALERLIEVTEWLLAERERFTGRLRRTSTPIAPPPKAPVVAPPVDIGSPATADCAGESRP